MIRSVLYPPIVLAMSWRRLTARSVARCNAQGVDWGRGVVSQAKCAGGVVLPAGQHSVDLAMTQRITGAIAFADSDVV